MSPRQRERPEGSLAQRIELLFKHAYPATRGPYDHDEVVAGVSAQLGHKISRSYLYSLRNGGKTNPHPDIMKALADFFDVPHTYFWESASSDELRETLETARALERADLRLPMGRSFGDLSPEQLMAQERRWARLEDIMRRRLAATEGKQAEPGD